MGKLFHTIRDISQATSLLAEKPYGVIVAQQGALDCIQIRPFPKLISVTEALWIGGYSHKRIKRNRVQVYYNQPTRHPNYLVAKYAVSELGTTLATMRAAFKTFMEIARIKHADAVLCQVISRRITDRVMQYWGFERHNRESRGRHYIRRFYGNYPVYTNWLETSVTDGTLPISNG